jgi:uncharacterized protein with FMN-binding domain
MKKITMWLMSTLTGLVLLFGYHTSTSSSAAAAQGGNASITVPAISGTAGTTSSSTTAGGSTSSSSASGATSTTGASSSATTTVTGTAADTRYGPVQVQLTIANGTVTAVKVIEYPNSDGKDQQINARALPILIQETLKAQSAKIDMVSGATYTSNGYETSLQNALDKAGL